MPNPASVDELLAFIVSFVEDHYKSTRQGTNGALLAEKIRHEYPTFRYEQLALLKLSDAIALGEQKGLLVRNWRVNHLEVLPVGTTESARAVEAHLGRVGTPHVRPDIWRAFVFVSQSECYCYDRETSNVVNASTADVSNAERFVAISPIGLTEQQQWMVEFVKSKTDLDSHRAPIQDLHCFTTFPAWLREHESGLDRAWKQFRVLRVTEKVRQWAIANAIDPALFFSVPVAARAHARKVQEGRYEQVIRAAIASAARDLPIEELLDFPIPIRYVLRALESR